MQLKYDNVPSIFVFLYNVKNNIPCTVTDDNPTTVKTLSPLVNSMALMNGYYVDNDLKTLSTMEISIPLSDFGITILMLYFAKYYSHGQYPLYVHTFRCIAELEIIEKFLLAYNQKSIKLMPNLATHEVYGLKRQNFNGTKHLTVEAFQYINKYMCSPEITPERFIECIKTLNVHIVESFYIFTSITKNCKIINECHDLMHKSLAYTFQKPIKSLRYDGDYWFELPAKAIWFAYFQGQVKFSSYISCDIKSSLRCFDLNNVKCLVLGFTHDASIYPLIFEDPDLYGDWRKTIDFMKNCNFNCVLCEGTPAKHSKKIHFVKNHIVSIFKLEQS